MGKHKQKRKLPRRKRDRERQLAMPTEPPKKAQWWKVPLGILSVLSAVLGIVGVVLGNLPKLSVDVSGSLQPSSPMGTIFYLSNDGALPVHDVVVTCGNLEITGQNLLITGMGAEFQAHPEARADVLSPGHKMTLPYAPAFGFTAISNFTGARLVIRAHYRPDYFPWPETAIFPFQAIRTATGNWIWRSIPQ
jgi:hypothetical protein